MTTPIRDEAGNPPPHPPFAPNPGKKTTEFVLTILAMLLGAVLSLGLVGPDSVYGQVIGAALALLAHLGYSASRAVVKSNEAKAHAIAADSASRAEAVKALQDPTKRSRSTE